MVDECLNKKNNCDSIRIERAKWFIKRGDFLNALRLYYQIDKERLKKEAINIINCWINLGNYKMAYEWIDYLEENLENDNLSMDIYNNYLLQDKKMREIYRLNINALLKRDQDLADIVLNYKLKGDVTWIILDKEIYLVKIEDKMIHKISFKKDKKTKINILRNSLKGIPILIFNLSELEILYLIFNNQPEMFLTMKQPIYIIEKSIEIFQLILKLFDLREMLSSQRVFWFVGNKYRERIEEFFLKNLKHFLPLHYIYNYANEIKEIRDIIGKINTKRNNLHKKYLMEMNQYYNSLSLDNWKKIYSDNRDRPIKILFVTSRYTSVLQYCISDLEDAFKELGCETRIYIENSDVEVFSHISLTQSIANFKPDMIFTIDHLRYEYDGHNFETINYFMPYVCWIQDRLSNLFDVKYINKLSDRDFIYTMTVRFAKECYKSGYKKIKMLPVAYNQKIYNTDVSLNEEYQCDISFVANIGDVKFSSNNLLFIIKEMVKEGKICYYKDTDYYVRVIMDIVSSHNINIQEYIQEYINKECSLDDLGRYISSITLKDIMRCENILWADELGLDIKLFGNGWNNILELKKYAMGTIPNRSEKLKSIYNLTKINLHINHDVNVHFRVFECIASGGFILVKEHSSDFEVGGLNKYLEIGKEVITYNSKEDFQDKVIFYLKNESERIKVIEAGKRRVLKEHTYINRARKVIEDISNRFRIRHQVSEFLRESK